TADQQSDRLAALAWWATERVATAATESIVEAEGDEHVAERLRTLLERGILPQADVTDLLWDLLRPGTATSSFAFGTMEVWILWGVALLAAGARHPVGVGPSVPRSFQSVVAVTVLGSIIHGFPP